MARAGDGTMTNTAPAHPSTIPTPAHPTTPSLPQATPKPYISHPPPSSPAHHSKEPARVPSTKTALGVTGKLTMPPQCMQREQRSPCSSVSLQPCMSGQMDGSDIGAALSSHACIGYHSLHSCMQQPSPGDLAATLPETPCKTNWEEAV